jgi:tRNA pseudouridine55 synthase
MDGILVIDKPAGWTSHDVVARVRRLTRARRVGHTGTLDPLATGVLVICIGRATRVVEYMVGHDKRYRATIRLGVETDTYDVEGRVTAQHPVGVSEVSLRSTLQGLTGDIRQVPPMYSALKRDGKKLVDLARRGVEVEREPRRVTVYAIDVLSFDPPDATIDVHCSAGTYIRSLAHDAGRALGCGAILSALTRTAAGDFTLEQAVSLERFEAAVEEGSWPSFLRPLDAGLAAFPAVTLGEEDARRARHGMSIPETRARASLAPLHASADVFRVYDPAGRIVGLMRWDAQRSELRPEKILTPALSGVEGSAPSPHDTPGEKGDA